MNIRRIIRIYLATHGMTNNDLSKKCMIAIPTITRIQKLNKISERTAYLIEHGTEGGITAQSLLDAMNK